MLTFKDSILRLNTRAIEEQVAALESNRIPITSRAGVQEEYAYRVYLVMHRIESFSCQEINSPRKWVECQKYNTTQLLLLLGSSSNSIVTQPWLGTFG